MDSYVIRKATSHSTRGRETRMVTVALISFQSIGRTVRKEILTSKKFDEFSMVAEKGQAAAARAEAKSRVGQRKSRIGLYGPLRPCH